MCIGIYEAERELGYHFLSYFTVQKLMWLLLKGNSNKSFFNRVYHIRYTRSRILFLALCLKIDRMNERLNEE